jgi:general secretion pathway protein J
MTSRNREHAPPQQAFTLVEVLVAMLAAAIVAALSYRGLDALIASRAQLDAGAARWLAIHRFLDALETDLRFALPRPTRDAGGTAQPALLGQAAAVGPYSAQLSLVQDGAAAGRAPRRVAYRWVEDRIEFLRWPTADLPPYGDPIAVTMLEGVAKWTLRYQGSDGVWRDQWAPGGPTELPRGIEIRLEMKDGSVGGPIERVIAR